MERDPVFDIGLPTNLDLSLPDSAVEVSREFTTRVARLAIRFHELNEAPPLEALVAAFCEHLDIDADLLRMIVFAGQLVALDREFGIMTLDEREEWIADRDRQMAEMEAIIEEAVEETLAEVENRDAEIEMLNNLWSDSPDE